MQNEPNFHQGKNEPNPIHKKGLRNFYIPSDNEKRTQNEPNSNPILLWTKPMQPSLPQRLTTITHASALRQNKPNSNPIEPNNQSSIINNHLSPLAHSPKRQPKACRAFLPLAHKKKLTARRKQISHPPDRQPDGPSPRFASSCACRICQNGTKTITTSYLKTAQKNT